MLKEAASATARAATGWRTERIGILVLLERVNGIRARSLYPIYALKAPRARRTRVRRNRH
jgi:hypothetical protein